MGGKKTFWYMNIVFEFLRYIILFDLLILSHLSLYKLEIPLSLMFLLLYIFSILFNELFIFLVNEICLKNSYKLSLASIITKVFSLFILLVRNQIGWRTE